MTVLNKMRYDSGETQEHIITQEYDMSKWGKHFSKESKSIIC